MRCFRYKWSTDTSRCGRCRDWGNALLLLCAKRYRRPCAVSVIPLIMLESVLVHVVHHGLEDAANRGNIVNMQFFLTRGLPLTKRALNNASWNGDLKTVRFIIDNGYRLGLTLALSHCISRKQDQMYELLVNDRLFLIKKKKYTSRILFAAVLHRRLDLIKRIVLDHNADIHCVNGDGNTLLHVALRASGSHLGQNYSIMKWLVQDGVHPWVRNKQGFTIYESYFGNEYKVTSEWWDFITALGFKTNS